MLIRGISTWASEVVDGDSILTIYQISNLTVKSHNYDTEFSTTDIFFSEMLFLSFGVLLIAQTEPRELKDCLLAH